MIFTFETVCDYFSNKKFPYINQAKFIANKYKELYNSNIKKSTELYFIGNYSPIYSETHDTSSLDFTRMQEIEEFIFGVKIKSLKKLKTYLKKKLGISKESYLILYDYENISTYKDNKTSGIQVCFQSPRIFLLLFEKEHYNFIRLAYYESPDTQKITKSISNDYLNLFFDFDLDEF